jgi:hypothetical protein
MGWLDGKRVSPSHIVGMAIPPIPNLLYRSYAKLELADVRVDRMLHRVRINDDQRQDYVSVPVGKRRQCTFAA